MDENYSMSIDKTVFKAINSSDLPPVFNDIFIYAHGMRNMEIAFFLFCVILFVIVVGAPKKGPRAAIAVFIASMVTYFGAASLRKMASRPYPELDAALGAEIKVNLLKASSAFPVVSNVMFATVAMSIVFYFPKYTAGLLMASAVYALMPVYLGVAYPSDAVGSLVVGYVAGYVLMTFLAKTDYFARY